MITEDFAPRGVASQIRNSRPGRYGTPPADHWVDYPALAIKQQGRAQPDEATPTGWAARAGAPSTAP